MGRPSRLAVRRQAQVERAPVLVGNPTATYRDFMGAERQPDCARYRECLDHASMKLWVDFSCDDCEKFATSDLREIRAAAAVIGSSLTKQEQDY